MSVPSLTSRLRQDLWAGYMLAHDRVERERLGALYAEVAEAQSCPVCHDHQPFCSRAPWVGGDISVGSECGAMTSAERCSDSTVCGHGDWEETGVAGVRFCRYCGCEFTVCAHPAGSIFLLRTVAPQWMCGLCFASLSVDECEVRGLDSSHR